MTESLAAVPATSSAGITKAHYAALAACGATFGLLLVGGTVNPTGSSLACPEAWFVCNGSILPEMSGGVLYEHGHRLFAMSVGLIQIVLTWLLWRQGGLLRKLGLLALVMVCAQGSLGAATVAYKLPTSVSTSHLMLAMTYFALLIYLAWRTRAQARQTPQPARDPATERMNRLIGISAGAVYLQIALGAFLRHTGGALACIDLPLCHGSLWPEGAQLPLQVHMLHRIVGVLVGLLVLWMAVRVARAASNRPWLNRGAKAAGLLVLTQVTLGVFTIMTFRSTLIVVIHLGVAALLWGLTFTMWLATRPTCAVPSTASATSLGSDVLVSESAR